MMNVSLKKCEKEPIQNSFITVYDFKILGHILRKFLHECVEISKKFRIIQISSPLKDDISNHVTIT